MARRAAENSVDSNGLSSKRGSSIDDAHQKIKEMLYVNELTGGQRIVCKDLGRRLGISITPIIQALNRLEASGFVTYLPNTGYFVCELSANEAVELFEARRALELHVVPKIIQNATEEKLNQIHMNFHDKRNEVRQLTGRSLAFRDARYHLAIVEIGGNEFICKTLKDIFEKLYLKFRPENVGQMDLDQIFVEHQTLFEALRNRDQAAATQAVRDHLDSSEQRFLHTIRRQKEVLML